MKYQGFLLLICPMFCFAQNANDARKWSGSAQGYYYFIPQETLPPTIVGTADIRSFHVEARYNYEDINSASLFGGYTFCKTGKLEINATPMVGIVAGNSNGILPGFEFEAKYNRFYFYSENEYMFNLKGKENNFFYSWTELNVETIKNLRVGVLAQSLRWYKTAFDVQRGVYTEYNLGSFTFGFYYFNPFSNYSFITTGLSVDF